MSDVAFAGIARQAEMVRAGDVTPTDLVELYLDRIEPAGARAERIPRRPGRPGAGRGQADRGAPRRRRGESDATRRRADRRQGHGRPDGEITTWGTNGFDQPAKDDGEMVRRLRAAGAIILGKTNLPELAICGFTETEAWGITRNPWDTSRTPGGSSGGSAAATAAGLCAGASGVRRRAVPSASPPRSAGSSESSRSATASRSRPRASTGTACRSPGCVTRTVEDSALWLDVCHGGVAGGPPPPDHSFVEASHAAPRRLRIAWSTKPPRLAAPGEALRRGRPGRRGHGLAPGQAGPRRRAARTPTGA